jgi:hypothetical protein
MSTLASHRVREATEPSGRDPTILATLFGESQGLYRIQRSTLLLSFLLHVLAAGLLFMSSTFIVTHRRQIRQQVVGLVTDVSPYVLPASATKAGGGGGGGPQTYSINVQVSSGNNYTTTAGTITLTVN